MRATWLLLVWMLSICAVALESRAWLVADADEPALGAAAEAVLFEPNGDLLSGGFLGSQLVIRRHASGDGRELWRFGVARSAAPAQGVSLAHDDVGDVLAALYQTLADGSPVGTIVKLDPTTGAERWRIEIPDVRLYGIAADASGDAVAVGIEGRVTEVHESFAVKVSGRTGAELWRVEKPGSYPNENFLQSVAAAPNGDFFVAGSLAKPRYLHDPGAWGFSVLRLRSSDGAELWWQEIGNFGIVHDIAVDPSGDVVAVGEELFYRYLVTKLNGSDGAPLWNVSTAQAPYLPNEQAAAVAIDPAGDVFVAASLADPAWPTYNARSVTTLKLAGPTGDLLWRDDVSNSNPFDYGCCFSRDIAVGPDGNPVSVGMLINWQNPRPVAFKLSSADGTPLWRAYPETDASYGAAIAVGPDGSVGVVTARGYCLNNYCGRFTLKKLRGRSGRDYFTGCGDEIDNDGDGRVDFGDDAGCASDSSATESPACQNGIDDDGDGRADYPADPGCARASSATETPACNDGIDDDGDGLVDTQDPGCMTPASDVESPACSDGIDDDGDGLVDYPEDPGCAVPSSPTEDPPCQNGIDDDYDGFADFPADPGCASPSGPTERPACQDGWDDDGDGAIDFDGGASANHGYAVALPDPDCAVPFLLHESTPSLVCGLGAEIAGVVPVLVWLRRRSSGGPSRVARRAGPSRPIHPR